MGRYIGGYGGCRVLFQTKLRNKQWHGLNRNWYGRFWLEIYHIKILNVWYALLYVAFEAGAKDEGKSRLRWDWSLWASTELVPFFAPGLTMVLWSWIAPLVNETSGLIICSDTLGCAHSWILCSTSWLFWLSL